MAFAPKLESGISGTSPTTQTHPLEGVSKVTGGLLGTGASLFDTYQKAQADAADGGEDRLPENVLERKSLENVAYDLDVAASLERNGRSREAEVMRRRAFTRHVTSWGATDELDDLARLKTGRSLDLNTKTPEQMLLENFRESEEFPDIYATAAGALRAEGNKTPTQDQLLERSMLLYQKDLVDTQQAAFSKRADANYWQNTGRQFHLNKLTNLMNKYDGVLFGLNNQGNDEIPVDNIMAAMNEVRMLRSNAIADMPAGAPDASVVAAYDNKLKVFQGLLDSPGNTVNAKLGNVAVRFLNDHPNATAGELAALSAMIKTPETILQWASGTQGFETMMESATKVLSYELGGVNNPDDDNLWTKEDGQQGKKNVEELSSSELENGFTANIQTADVLTLEGIRSDQDTMNAFDVSITRAAAAMAKGKNALPPSVVRSNFNPNLFDKLEAVKEKDPALYDTLVARLGEGLQRQWRAWDRRARAVSQSSVFLMRDGKVEPSAAKIKEKFPDKALDPVRKYYGGDVVAFFEDDGRKARGDANFVFLGNSLKEYKEIKKFNNASVWSLNTLRKLGVPEPTTGDIQESSQSGGNGSSFSSAIQVNSEEEMMALMERGQLNPGDLVRLPDGSIGRIK